MTATFSAQDGENPRFSPAPVGGPPPPEGRPAWYRRRAMLVTAAVAAILAVTVVSDLPQHTALPEQIAQEKTVIGEIHADASSCLYAVKEAFGFYADTTAGTLTAAERASVPGLLQGDQDACSFTNNAIFNLSNIEVPGSAAGRDVGEAVNTVTLWVTSDALSAIEAIITLTEKPGEAAALAQLATAERYLASDRDKVTSEIEAAERALRGASLPLPGLPVLPLPNAAG